MTSDIKTREHLAPEVEEGNREYKFKLTDLTDDQLTHRITQLNWRLNEGNDEAFYLIGVEDNGNQLGLNESDLQESLKNLQFIADQVGCEMMVRQLYAGEQGTTAEVYMRRRERITVDVVQVSVAVAGDLNSGKSTMIGVLSTGQLDNGKGLARSQVLTHNHEVESGRTSCISHHSLHFSRDGEILNADPLPGAVGNGSNKSNRLRALSDLELADETSRSVMLIDLAGHAKYLKTTLHGLIGRRPDHCIVCVSATTGLNSITTEHIGVSMYLNVPLIIVITKVDCVVGHSKSTTSGKSKADYRTKNAYGIAEEASRADAAAVAAATAPAEANSDAITRLVNSIKHVLSGPQRESSVISNDDELVSFLQRSADCDSSADASSDIPGGSKNLVPIFAVSNKTGDGLQLLKSYLFQLPTHAKQRQSLQMQSTCIRVLGSIGNIDEREEVVFPRDEDQFGKPKRDVRHSTNRYALNTSSASVRTPSGKASRSGAAVVAGCLGCGSNSEDNLLSGAGDAHTTPDIALIKRPHSSPDLACSGVKSAGSTPERAPLVPVVSKEFSEFVEDCDDGCSSGATSNRESPTGSRSTTTSSGQSRTKVLIGSIEAGTLNVGESMLFGPTCTGDFVSVAVSSLRLNNVPVRSASAGQTVTFKLTARPAAASAGEDCAAKSAESDARKSVSEGRRRTAATGLVLLSASSSSSSSAPTSSAGDVTNSDGAQATGSSSGTARAYWEFEAELLVLNHPSKIRVNYEPVVHVGCVRQSAKLVSVRKIGASQVTSVGNGCQQLKVSSAHQTERNVTADLMADLRVSSDEVGNGERAVCRFRFLYYPEFIIPGEAMIIREQRTRGVGTITRLI